MANSLACRLLFALLVALLPLQGFVAAVQHVARPAHFHVLVATQGVTVTGLSAGDVIETLHSRDDSDHAPDNASQTRHTHALGKVGVVYFNGDDDSASGSGLHKHSASFDVVLPGWSMAEAPRLPALVPAAPGVRFRSIGSGRIDRPPRNFLTV